MTIRLNVAQEVEARLQRAIEEALEGTRGLTEAQRSIILRPLWEELGAVRTRIDGYLRRDEALHDPNYSWLTFTGANVGEANMPFDLLGSAFTSLQTGVRQVANYLSFGQPASRRFRSELIQESQISLKALRPGSLKIAFTASTRLLVPRYPDGLANESLGLFARAMAWAASAQDFAQLSVILPNPIVRRQIACRIRDLAPSASGQLISTELSGYWIAKAELPEMVVLTNRANRHALAFLKDSREAAITITGRLVSLDVERDLIELRVEGIRIRCEFPQGLLLTAKQEIGNLVTVEGQGLYHEDDEFPNMIVVHRLSSTLGE